MPKIGYKITEEHRRKLSLAKIGKSPWNKGIPMSNEMKLKLISIHKGKVTSEETKRKISLALQGKNVGRKHTEKARLNMSLSRIGKYRGKDNPSWKGGITPVYKAIRNSIEYEEWRTKVFERDLYTCQMCGEIGGYLQADHIKKFSDYPELRFELSNGRTLCISCHYLVTFKKPMLENNKWMIRMKGGY